MYTNLDEYLSLLEKEGELIRVKATVDPVEEIAEIADRMSKSPEGGKALLFENTGTDFPVAINMFGSDRRMALALGVGSLDDIPLRIENFVGGLLTSKATLSGKLAAVPLLGKAAKWFPKKIKGPGECQQIVYRGEAARLDMLPVMKCWEHDGGRFFTLPLVHTVDPGTGARNVGMYRMQVFDAHTTGMHWHIHKTGAKHYEAYKKRGERMPVSVCLGGDPAYTYSAIAPMPDGIDEYLLAGFLREKPVKLVKCITNDLYVPHDCDFVIEGYVDPEEEKVTEGPFGDHTGFYSLEDLYARFHVTAITHRKNAVYPATIVGIPPQEDFYIAKATEKIFLAPIRLVMQPELEDMYMPGAGVAHNLALISIRKSYEGQAAKVVSSMWGAGQMMFNKYMIVADAACDIRNTKTVAALLRGADIPLSIIRGEGILDVLDHATATPGVGGKLALDLTGIPADAPLLEIPEGITASDGIKSFDLSLARQWGIIVLFAEPGVPVDPASFLSRNGLGSMGIAVIMDCRADGFSAYELLWLASGNSDPRRDASLAGGTLVVDSRTKLPGGAGNPSCFPNVVTSSARIIELVDRRWSEYGLGKFIESPSRRYRKLPESKGAEI